VSRQNGFSVSSRAYRAGGVCNHSPSDFKHRCFEQLERFGDSAMESLRHGEAHKYYSAALSIQPAETRGYFIMRSKGRMAKGLWEDALDDANKVSSVVSCKSFHIEAEASGDHTRSIITMGV
jgi:hypothetical protein